MKRPLHILVALALLVGCTSSVPESRAVAGDYLCVPTEYKVSLPGEGHPGDGFDPEGGGYGISIFMEEVLVAQEIPGYKPTVRRGKSLRHQSLYVGLAPISHFQRPLSELGPTHALDEHELLYATERDGVIWEVVERAGGQRTHWGTCADLFTEEGAFDCLRVLAVEDLVLTYTIDQENLQWYSQIDDLLQDRVEQWRCDSGDIPIRL